MGTWDRWLHGHQEEPETGILTAIPQARQAGLGVSVLKSRQEKNDKPDFISMKYKLPQQKPPVLYEIGTRIL